MPANQRYSTRLHSRRQLGRAWEHLTEVSTVLDEVGSRYIKVLPQIAVGCLKCNEMVNMLKVLIEDMRTNI